MGKLFRNIKPYWKSVIIIIVLLVVQAFCDLSIPQYTSNIIDVGIQNQGVEFMIPEAITEGEFEISKIIMNDDEKNQWESIFDKDGSIYRCNVKDKDELESLEQTFSVSLLLNYQLSMMEAEELRNMLVSQSPENLGSLSLEEIGNSMGIEFNIFEREQEDDSGEKTTVKCVDARPVFQSMQKQGTFTEETREEMRSNIQPMLDTMGDSLVSSMGIAYAIQCDAQAGLDMDDIQMDYLLLAGLKMLGMTLIMVVAAISVGYIASKVGAGVGRDLRKNTFSRVVQFSDAEMNRFSTASLITRSTNDIQQIQMVIAIFLRMLLYAPVLGIGGVIKVINTGAGMGWVIVLAVLLLLGIVGILMAIAMPKFKKMQQLIDKLNLVSREILTGLPVIRAFSRENTEEERFDKANKILTKTTLFTNRVMTFMMPTMMLLMNGLSILIVWVASHKIDGGNLQVGSMTAFITYAMMIVMSFLMLTMMSIMIPRASVAAGRIDEVLKTVPSIKESDNVKNLNNIKGEICFSNVSFRYPSAEEDALQNLNFTAKTGQITAIVGGTGSGKSTLVNLIPRLYDITKGQITLDGEDIKNISLKSLRDVIGFVPQKGVLFSGTISSNLRFGNAGATDAEIQEAASIAQATDFIEEKADRYESPIAQGGTNVSGGQKQRLTIARAIAKNPKIFIFDDSFSALDLKTDSALRKALAEKTKDSTVLIVAQRLSTILNADQILVLDEGKIVGKGKHEELLRNCEVYQQIAKSQLSEKELETVEKQEGGNLNEK